MAHETGKMKSRWRSPSNIALVKYWGKYPVQIPANPSLSFTLKNCYTETSAEWEGRKNGSGAPSFNFYFEGKAQKSFEPKIAGFFERIEGFIPHLKAGHLHIDSRNSFPHSTGIASSASAFSALALCVLELEMELSGKELPEKEFLSRASEMARLGSGSACRSLYGPLALWGKSSHFPGSSDEKAVVVSEGIHPGFLDYGDIILLVKKGKKAVSSSAGHGLMEGHPFAEARFASAQDNLRDMLGYMRENDAFAFAALAEREALTLHALMMSSRDPFVLMRPETLAIVQKIRDFRADSGIAACFTLDAGSNVHLLYPRKDESEVKDFVLSELIGYCQQEEYLCDQTGAGPEKIST